MKAAIRLYCLEKPQLACHIQCACTECWDSVLASHWADNHSKDMLGFCQA